MGALDDLIASDKKSQLDSMIEEDSAGASDQDQVLAASTNPAFRIGHDQEMPVTKIEGGPQRDAVGETTRGVNGVRTPNGLERLLGFDPNKSENMSMSDRIDPETLGGVTQHYETLSRPSGVAKNIAAVTAATAAGAPVGALGQMGLGALQAGTARMADDPSAGLEDVGTSAGLGAGVAGGLGLLGKAGGKLIDAGNRGLARIALSGAERARLRAIGGEPKLADLGARIRAAGLDKGPGLAQKLTPTDAKRIADNAFATTESQGPNISKLEDQLLASNDFGQTEVDTKPLTSELRGYTRKNSAEVSTPETAAALEQQAQRFESPVEKVPVEGSVHVPPPLPNFSKPELPPDFTPAPPLQHDLSLPPPAPKPPATVPPAPPPPGQMPLDLAEQQSLPLPEPVAAAPAPIGAQGELNLETQFPLPTPPKAVPVQQELAGVERNTLADREAARRRYYDADKNQHSSDPKVRDAVGAWVRSPHNHPDMQTLQSLPTGEYGPGYRGMKLTDAQLQEVLRTGEISADTLNSWSVNPDIARAFSHNSNNGARVLLRQPQTSGIPVGAHEGEVIAQPGKWDVSSASQSPNGAYNLDVTPQTVPQPPVPAAPPEGQLSFPESPIAPPVGTQLELPTPPPAPPGPLPQIQPELPGLGGSQQKLPLPVPEPLPPWQPGGAPAAQMPLNLETQMPLDMPGAQGWDPNRIRGQFPAGGTEKPLDATAQISDPYTVERAVADKRDIAKRLFDKKQRALAPTFGEDEGRAISWRFLKDRFQKELDKGVESGALPFDQVSDYRKASADFHTAAEVQVDTAKKAEQDLKHAAGLWKGTLRGAGDAVPGTQYNLGRLLKQAPGAAPTAVNALPSSGKEDTGRASERGTGAPEMTYEQRSKAEQEANSTMKSKIFAPWYNRLAGKN